MPTLVYHVKTAKIAVVFPNLTSNGWPLRSDRKPSTIGKAELIMQTLLYALMTYLPDFDLRFGSLQSDAQE